MEATAKKPEQQQVTPVSNLPLVVELYYGNSKEPAVKAYAQGTWNPDGDATEVFRKALNEITDTNTKNNINNALEKKRSPILFDGTEKPKLYGKPLEGKLREYLIEDTAPQSGTKFVRVPIRVPEHQGGAINYKNKASTSTAASLYGL
jgi:hypothetical protein